MNATPTPRCFKIKFCEDWVWKLNYKIGFLVLSTGHQNCLDKSLDVYNILSSVCNGFSKHRLLLSERKPEIQVSYDCLQRTLCKDSNDSFNEVIQNFKWKLNFRVIKWR